ncbi:MAG: ribbon-helix-helix domain-containing protein [Vicinamibacterales bacterium]
MADVLERINLNVPADVRQRLRELAARAGRTEAEVARALLVDALERARRDEFYRRVAEAHTPAIRARDLEILRAFESLSG